MPAEPTMAGFFQKQCLHLPKTPDMILENLFCGSGNGCDLDNLGYLRPAYYTEEEVEYPEPKPLLYLYPPSEHVKPYKKFAGCRNAGFKDAVEYFLKCLELTPDTIEHSTAWKAEIPAIRKCLIDTPSMRLPFEHEDDWDSFHKILESEEGKPRWGDKAPSMQKKWVLETTWTDCPKFVIEEVRQLWRSREFGNDYYFFKCDLDGQLFEDYPRIYMWAKHNGVKEGEEFLVHYWW